MKVMIQGTEELAKFTAELIRQGITFKAHPTHPEVNITSYEVELTGF